MGLKGVVVIFVIVGLFWHTGQRVQAFVPDPKNAWVLTGVIFGLMIGWNILYRLMPGLMDTWWFPGWVWVGSVLFGFWATYMIYALAIDLGAWVVGWFVQTGSPEVDPERRALLLTGSTWGLLGLAGVFTALGFRQARSGPRVVEVNVPVEGLPKELHQLTVAQISDLHVGPTIGREYVEDVVNRTLALNPDLIVITGDLADGDPDVLREDTEPLKRLKGRLGTYYVTGNHEYYWGGEAWVQATRAFGWTPLINEHVVLTVQGKTFLVAGVTDESAGQFVAAHSSDAHKALKGGEGADFKLLLAHRPNTCVEASKLGFHLQLSGHTHGGQFLPFPFFVQLAHKYYRGLNKHDGMWVYVSVGTGYWGPPHRFGVPSEISLIRLQRG